MGKSKRLFEKLREEERLLNNEDLKEKYQQELDDFYENHIEEMYEAFKEREGYERQNVLPKTQELPLDGGS